MSFYQCNSFSLCSSHPFKYKYPSPRWQQMGPTPHKKRLIKQKHAATSQKQRNQVVEVALTSPLWLLIATCLTFTKKLFLINSSLQAQSTVGTLTLQCISENSLHPDSCTVRRAPQEQDKPGWKLQKQKIKNEKITPNISRISF